ncbi:MAG TPA: hypothetical protein VHL59_09080 [Thermoanaerobaculia bacterium]|nr:hypothetical protein [Thermoanaerobaculia bacterium]
MWAFVAAHAVLLAITLADYRVTIDSGYHVSLGRYYAEHGTAWWDPINWGPRGRPNLQGPLMHVAIGALGRILGGSGDAYVLGNALVSFGQWLAAIFTIIFFARRYGGDWPALFAIALFTGSALTSLSFYVGLPSGWIFIFTPWAIWFFLQRRWLLAALLVAAACYAHLGGFATAPVGIAVAAILARRWKHLLYTGAVTAALTLPYLIHFYRYRSWYIGDRGHVAGGLATPLIYLLAIPGVILLLRRPRENAMLLAWAIAPIAWLFQDAQRFALQWDVGGVVIAGVFLGRFSLRPIVVAAIIVIATVFPLSISGFLPEVTWAAGLRYPRMIEWDEAKRLADIVHRQRLDRRLVYVYNHSFAPALAVYHPMTFERGHWVEVQPRPNPANQLSAGIKTYVMPVPPDDPVLRGYERAGLLKVHGGTSKSSVVTLTRPGELRTVAAMIARTIPPDAYWLADRAVNNTLDPVADLFSASAIAARRAQRLRQRTRAGRIAVGALVYSYALEPHDAKHAEGSRGSVRGYSSIAAFLSDEWSLDFVDDERHQRLRENFRNFGREVEKLDERVMPFEELSKASDRLFDDYFWAA